MKDFITPELITKQDVGVGDDTFMIGRFIGHDGRERNAPALRFGNVAMMPIEKITDEVTGFRQESFLVETRSLPGYSGSPVFLYSPAAINDFSQRDLKEEMEELQKKYPDVERVKTLS